MTLGCDGSRPARVSGVALLDRNHQSLAQLCSATYGLNDLNCLDGLNLFLKSLLHFAQQTQVEHA